MRNITEPHPITTDLNPWCPLNMTAASSPAGGASGPVVGGPGCRSNWPCLGRQTPAHGPVHTPNKEERFIKITHRKIQVISPGCVYFCVGIYSRWRCSEVVGLKGKWYGRKVLSYTHTHTHINMHAYMHTQTQTHSCTHTCMCAHTHNTNTHTCMHVHTYTHTHTNAHTSTHTHTHTLHAHTCYMHTHTHTELYIRAMRLKKRFLKQERFHGRFKRTDRGRMTDRNRELAQDGFGLVREKALTTGLCLEGWCSKHLGVCRRAKLLGRNVKVKKFWKGRLH